MEYTIIIHRAEEGGYWAEVPALEGCFAQAESIDELLVEIRAAIASHLEAMQEWGQSPPRERGIIIATVNLPELSPA